VAATGMAVAAETSPMNFNLYSYEDSYPREWPEAWGNSWFRNL
jgi:hypothetical protein